MAASDGRLLHRQHRVGYFYGLLQARTGGELTQVAPVSPWSPTESLPRDSLEKWGCGAGVRSAGEVQLTPLSTGIAVDVCDGKNWFVDV